jgi:hypothetical protein
MVALTRDFHVFASRVAARFSAVFFSNWYIAQARYVRALSHLFIYHLRFLPFRFFDDDSIATLNVAGSVISTDCMQISKPASR